MLTSADQERLVTGVWADLATSRGIVADTPVTALDADKNLDVVLSGPELPRTAYQVKRFAHPIKPSVLQQLAAAGAQQQVRLLVITSDASPDTRRFAEEAGISLLTTRDGAPTSGTLHTPAGVVRLELPPLVTVRPRARGRVPWGTYAVAFALLDGPARDQAQLAARAGVGRPRVTQVLAQLDGLVDRTSDGWAATDPRALAAWLAERYPVTPHLATTWATLDPPVRAAQTVSAYLTNRGVRHAVTGDVAADQLAPWARPATAWLWVAAPVDLQPVGLTPAPPEAATVTLAVPEDPHLLDTAHRTPDGLPLLAAWRVWVDLIHQGHPDAAAALADALLAGRTP